MKKIRLMAIALLAGSLGLASCGKEESANNNPGEQQSGEQQTVKKVNSVAISSENDVDAIKVGEKLQLTATVEVEGDAAKTVSWKSSDTSVATVSSKGLVTAKKAADEVIITATSTVDKTKSATFSLTINEADGVVSVTIIGAEDGDQVKVADSIFLGTQVAVTGDASKEVVWETSNSSIATVSQSGMVTGVDEGTVTITAKAKDDISKSDKVTLTIWCDPHIVSIAVSGEPQNGEVALNTTLALSAEITKKGNPATDITWSSSNTSVAEVDAKTGVVTPKSEGTFTITATAVFAEIADGSHVFGTSQQMTVVDHGFAPEFYDKGFHFTKEWSDVENAIEEFLGTGEYSIIAPASIEGGIYYMAYEEDEEGPAQIAVVIDGVQAETYYGLLGDAGWTKLYESSMGSFDGVDPTLTYTVSAMTFEDEETYEPIAPTVLTFFKSADVWAPSVKTTDEAWNKTHYGEDASDEDFTEIVDEWISHVPFIELGNEYEIEYQDMSFYRYYYDIDVPDYVTISDYVLDESFLSGYDQILLDAGFAYVNEGDYYFIDDEYLEYIVYFEWGEGGNTIFVQQGLATLTEWPASYIADFCENVAGSIYSLPALEGLDEYAFSVEVDYDEEGYPYEYAYVSAGEITKTAADEYAGVLEGDGFTVVATAATNQTYAKWNATKGMLDVTIIFVENYDPVAKEYDPNNGTLVFYIEYNSSIHEVPGLYALGQGMYLEVGDTLPLAEWLEVYQLESPTITFTSSDSTKASVAADGTITAVAETAEEEIITITATTVVEEQPYSATFGIIVLPKEVVGATFDYSELSDIEYTIGDFTVNAHKTGSEAAPVVFNNEELRVYANNQVTISSKGEPITSIDFYTCDCTSKVGANFTANVGTLTETSYGYHWEGNAQEVIFSCAKVDDNHKQSHFFSIEINGGGEGGGGSVDVDEELLEGMEDIAVDIASSYFGKTAEQLVVDHDYESEDEPDVEVVAMYFDYGFVYTDIYTEVTENQEADVNKMIASLPAGAVEDTEYSYTEEGYYDLWYICGDYSIGIYHDGENSSISVVPTEMLDIYIYYMYE